MKTGIIAGSFKPFHRGHFSIIKNASDDNDNVIVFVSMADRIRPGEYPIRGDAMVKIWEDFLIPNLPKNVEVKTVKSPIRSVYEMIGNTSSTDTVFSIYSDFDDAAKNFPEKSIVKYFSNIPRECVQIVPIKRVEDLNISGTIMRQFLKDNEKEKFNMGLPSFITTNDIWNILRGG